MKKAALALSAILFLISMIVAVSIARSASNSDNVTDETDCTYSAGFADGMQTFIFGENVNARKVPEIDSGNIIDKLDVCQPVTVIGNEGKYTAEGITQKWYKIEYEKGGKKKIGFVWGGILALTYAEVDQKSNIMVIVGLKKIEKGGEIIAEARLIRAGRILSAAEFKPHDTKIGGDASEYCYNASKGVKSGARGLEQFNDIAGFYFCYEACGYTCGTAWFGIKNDKICFLLRDDSESEAGIYRIKQKVIFPADNEGVKNKIVKKETLSTFDEKKNDYVVKKTSYEKYTINESGVSKEK